MSKAEFEKAFAEFIVDVETQLGFNSAAAVDALHHVREFLNQQLSVGSAAREGKDVSQSSSSSSQGQRKTATQSKSKTEKDTQSPSLGNSASKNARKTALSASSAASVQGLSEASGGIPDWQGQRMLKEVSLAVGEKLYQHGDTRQLFIHYDRTGSGFLSRQEFALAISDLGIDLSSKEVDWFMSQYGEQRFGEQILPYNGFRRMMDARFSRMESEEHAAYSAGVLYYQNGEDTSVLEKPMVPLQVQIRKLAGEIRDKLYQKYDTTTALFLHLDVGEAGHLHLEEFQYLLDQLGLWVELDDLKLVLHKYLSADGTMNVQQVANFMNGR